MEKREARGRVRIYGSMLIATIAIGLLAAWHFGFRAGAIAAGLTFVLLIAAIVMPGHALMIYAVVGAGVVGICFLGPRLSRDEARPVKRSLRAAYKIGKQLLKQFTRRAD